MSEVPVRFPGRELKTHCDYVRAEDLIVGEVYFRVHFLDGQGLAETLGGPPHLHIAFEQAGPVAHGGKLYIATATPASGAAVIPSRA